MNLFKTEKGITIVALILTVILVIILTTVSAYTIKSSNNVAPYNKMIADITLLEEKLLIYYNKYNTVPIVANTAETIDNVEYNKIDLGQLGDMTLNLGFDKEEGDYYLVSSNLKVYYKNGTEKSGETVHVKP